MATKTNQKNQQVEKPKRRVPILAIVFVGVLALLLAAIFLGGGDGPADPDQEYGSPQVTGDRLAFYPNPPPATVDSDPAFGAVAPTVSGTDFEDLPVAIEHDGTPQAVVFLAHWCPHCQAEVPEVTRWLNETGGVEGVKMTSVATSIDPRQNNFPPSTWLEDEGWPVPVLRDDDVNTVLNSYGAGGFPYWVFLDGDGRVVSRTSGRIPIDQLEGILTALTTL